MGELFFNQKMKSGRHSADLRFLKRNRAGSGLLRMIQNMTGIISEIPDIFGPNIDHVCILSRSDISLDSPGEIRGSG